MPTQVENKRGEWVPAIPLPVYVSFGVRCGSRHADGTRLYCNEWFRTTRRYREHYALVHILGLD